MKCFVCSYPLKAKTAQHLVLTSRKQHFHLCIACANTSKLELQRMKRINEQALKEFKEEGVVRDG